LFIAQPLPPRHRAALVVLITNVVGSAAQGGIARRA